MRMVRGSQQSFVVSETSTLTQHFKTNTINMSLYKFHQAHVDVSPRSSYVVYPTPIISQRYNGLIVNVGST